MLVMEYQEHGKEQETARRRYVGAELLNVKYLANHTTPENILAAKLEIAARDKSGIERVVDVYFSLNEIEQAGISPSKGMKEEDEKKLFEAAKRYLLGAHSRNTASKNP